MYAYKAVIGNYLGRIKCLILILSKITNFIRTNVPNPRKDINKQNVNCSSQISA
jgi:hypothetical protein